MRRNSTILAALAYFASVFGAGFVLGAIRTVWLAPRLGERWAELLEMPVMLLVIVAACRMVTRRWPAASPVWVGLLGLTLMLGAEFGLVLWLRELTFTQYLATRDPVSGSAYYAALAVFAVLPWLFRRSRRLSGL